jgi:hypothetical protein
LELPFACGTLLGLMVTAIVTYQQIETHIRRYDTNDPHEAMRLFLQDWIAGRVEWKFVDDFYGPNCAAEVPAFTPEFLRQNCLNNPEFKPSVIEGVHIQQWYCCNGDHDSNEHTVTGYFIPAP